MRSAYDRALARLLAAPSDAEVSFDFAQAAIAASEPRAAIAALERILVFDPTLANIRLELGTLYPREGATQLAERRLQEALASPDAPPEIRERAEALLREAQAANDRLRVYGSAYLGVQGDSNASAAPGSPTVQIVVGGEEVAAQLDTESVGQADVSAVTLLTGTLEYDLGFQRDHVLIVEGAYFGNRHLEVSEFDIDAFNLVVGPDLKLTDDNDVAIRPFVIGSYVRQDRTGFLQSGGAGVEVFYSIGDTLDLRGQALVLYQDFIQSREEPTNNLRDGTAVSFRPAVDWLPDPTRRVTGGIELRRSGARAALERFYDIAPFVSVSQLLPSPIDAGGTPWIASGIVSYRYRPYDAPDPAISLSEAETDNRVDLRLSLQVPVFLDAAVVAQAGYTKNFSTYAVDEFDNLRGSLGIETASSLARGRRR